MTNLKRAQTCRSEMNDIKCCGAHLLINGTYAIIRSKKQYRFVNQNLLQGQLDKLLQNNIYVYRRSFHLRSSILSARCFEAKQSSQLKDPSQSIQKENKNMSHKVYPVTLGGHVHCRSFKLILVSRKSQKSSDYHACCATAGISYDEHIRLSQKSFD